MQTLVILNTMYFKSDMIKTIFQNDYSRNNCLIRVAVIKFTPAHA